MGHPPTKADQPRRFRAHPEVLAAVFEQENDAVIRQARGVVDVEAGESVAVKAYQSVQGAEPEITIACLGEGDDRALGQTVGGAPHVHNIRVVGCREPVVAGRCQKQQKKA